MLRPFLSALTALLLLPAALFAADFGDAPASYGLPRANLSQPERLGTAFSDDNFNPVTPAWTGDNDDGVSVIPTWLAGTNNNSVSIFVYVGGVYQEYLTMFVDFNDDGDFLDAGERIDFPTLPITQNGNYTFNNIAVPSMVYSRNGANKIAVRFILKFAAAIQGPSENFNYGEIEDYLFTVTPQGLYVITPSPLPVGAQGVAYAPIDVAAGNGTPPFQWSVAGGSSPPGLGLFPIGNNYRISGTPSTPGIYFFTVQVIDAASAVAQRMLEIQVIPPPAALPFLDDFATDRGWTLGAGSSVTWQRAPCGPAYQPDHGMPEPTSDHSPGTDNYILGDNIGAHYPDNVGGTLWAVSPAFDCSGISEVELRFWRWLNIEQPQFDHAFIEVSSNNGSSWAKVWENTVEITDNSWVETKIDISAHAANLTGVRVRFGIGSTDTSYRYAGWCIDDFEIRWRPSTSKLVATDFRVLSPYKVGSQADPRVYTGTQTPFEITVDNTTAAEITVTAFQVEVVEFIGSGNLDIGTFTLTAMPPFVVPPNATGMVLTGVLDCTSIGGPTADVALRARATLAGHETLDPGLALETESLETMYVDFGPPPPPPMLETREGGFSGALVAHGQPAAGSARNFGNRDVNKGGSSWLNITLVNKSGAAVQVARPVLLGADAAHFRLDTAEWTASTMTLTVSGQDSQIFFSVRFDPHDIGPRAARVEFAHNASLPADSPYRVELAGTGTGAAPALEAHEVAYTGPLVAPGAPAAGTQRDLGPVAVGQSSRWLNIVLWNRNATPTAITAPPVVSGPDAAHFVLDTGALVSPIAGTTDFTGVTYFSVRFAPQSAGAKSAVISFSHSAANPPGPAYEFEVIGLGVDTPNTPLIAVAESVNGSPTYAISNGSQPEFGRDFKSAVAGGAPSATLEIRVSNTGNTSLTVAGPALAGQHAVDFVLDTSNFLNVLNPGQGTTFTVQFAPGSVGVKLASVSFTHTAAAQTATPFLFIVTGEGVPNSARLEVFEDNAGGAPIGPGSSALGTERDLGSRDVNAGAGASLTIFVRNVGTMDMTLGVPELAGAAPGQFALNTGGMLTTVPAGGSTMFSVALDPSSYGTKSAMVSFTHNDPSLTSPFVFEVVGFGDAPHLEMHDGGAAGPLVNHDDSPAGSRDFGSVDLSALPTGMRLFTVVNAGNATLTLGLPTLTGPNSASFQVNAAGFPSTLGPGLNASFTVRFTATQVGLKEATVSITHTDGGVSTPFLLRLQGKATSATGVRIASALVLPRGRIGVPYYAVNLLATGGASPYAWSVRAGSTLPQGFVLNAPGTLYGYPDGPAGEFSFTLRVSDANGGTDDATFVVYLDPAAGSGFGKIRGQASDGCAAGLPAAPLGLLALAALSLRRRRR